MIRMSCFAQSGVRYMIGASYIRNKDSEWEHIKVLQEQKMKG